LPDPYKCPALLRNRYSEPKTGGAARCELRCNRTAHHGISYNLRDLAFSFLGKRYAGKVTIVSSLRLVIFFSCSAEVSITERCSIDDFDSGRVGGSLQFRDGTYVQAAVPWWNRFLSLYLSQRPSPAFASNQSSAALRID
jgi:hypothetical protein